MSDEIANEPKVRCVIVSICEPCIRGEGQECHTPGCALFLHRVDLPIHEELLGDADAALSSARAEGSRDIAREIQDALQFDVVHEGRVSLDAYDNLDGVTIDFAHGDVTDADEHTVARVCHQLHAAREIVRRALSDGASNDNT